MKITFLPLAVAALIGPFGTAVAEVESPVGGLVSYWSFDDHTADGAWLVTADSGTAEDNLRVVGGPPQYVPGKVGRAIVLSGSHLTARFSADVRLAPSYTIEAWIKPDDLTGPWQRLVLNWGSEKGYHFAVHDGQISLYHKQTDGEEPHAEGGAVVKGKWQHVAAVADAAAKRLTVYLDGRPVARLDYDGSMHATTREGLGVGDSAGGPAEASKFSGGIDELAIWNVPLSDAQIESHYKNPQQRFSLTGKTFRQVVIDHQPEAYWQLDAPGGTDVRDAAGNRHDGSCQGGAQLGVPGIGSLPDNRAASLDGLDDYIDLGDVDRLDGLGAVSMEAWICCREPAGGYRGVGIFLRKEQVFAFGTGWVGEHGASLTQRRARFWIHADGRWLHSDNGTTDLDDGRWHHVAGVYDGQFVRIYVDGIQESSRKIGAVTLSANARALMIGSASGRGEFFSGRIDEVAVYRRALSPTEVYEHYVFAAEP